MKQKSEVRSDAAEPEQPWVRRSLSRARVQLSHAVADAITTSREVIEERLSTAPKPGDAAFGRMRDLLQRDRANVARQDPDITDDTGPNVPVAASQTGSQPQARQTGAYAPTGQTGPQAVVAAAPVVVAAAPVVAAVPVAPAKPKTPPPPPPARKPSITTTQRVPVLDAGESFGAQPISQLMAAVPAAPPAPAPVETKAAAPVAAATEEASGSDPIRTLTMARLLAVQGYRKRALSIYDELLARDASDPNLRAEADRLRG